MISLMITCSGGPIVKVGVGSGVSVGMGVGVGATYITPGLPLSPAEPGHVVWDDDHSPDSRRSMLEPLMIAMPVSLPQTTWSMIR